MLCDEGLTSTRGTRSPLLELMEKLKANCPGALALALALDPPILGAASPAALLGAWLVMMRR